LIEITDQTMAIIPVADVKYSSKLINVNGEVYSEKGPLTLVKQACLHGGSTFEGRRRAIAKMTGVSHRVPIPISPQLNIYAFPTHSPKVWNCIWLFYYHIRSIKEATNNSSTIVFRDGKELQVENTMLSLKRQLHRTAHCIVRLSPPKRNENIFYIS
jgi:competence protein ComK